MGNKCTFVGRVVKVCATEKLGKDPSKPFYKRQIIVDDSEAGSKYANEVAFEHYRHWNAKHVHRELGCTPHEARTRCCELGHTRMKVPPALRAMSQV